MTSFIAVPAKLAGVILVGDTADSTAEITSSAPVLGGGGNTVFWTEGQAPQPIDMGLTVSDAGGPQTLEVHKDAVGPDLRVVIADDLLATGGTSLAAVHLAEKLGAKVAAVSFVIELEALKGRHRLAGYNVVSLLKY